MKILEAVATLVAAHEAGQVELPSCPVGNGLDLNVEFVVALALADNRLAGCKTADDLLDAAVHAGADLINGVLDEKDLDRAMIRVIREVERMGERLERESRRLVAEAN